MGREKNSNKTQKQQQQSSSVERSQIPKIFDPSFLFVSAKYLKTKSLKLVFRILLIINQSCRKQFTGRMEGGDLWSKSRGFERLDAESRNFDCERHNYTSKIKKGNCVYKRIKKQNTLKKKNTQSSQFSALSTKKKKKKAKTRSFQVVHHHHHHPPLFSFYFFLLLFSLHIFK